MKLFRFFRRPGLALLVLVAFGLVGCTRNWSDSPRVVIPLDEPTVEIVILPETPFPDVIVVEIPITPVPPLVIEVVATPEPLFIPPPPTQTPLVIVVEQPTPTPFVFYVTPTPNWVVLLPQTGADLTAPARPDLTAPLGLILAGLVLTVIGLRSWRR
jgi:hypothetical protein